MRDRLIELLKNSSQYITEQDSLIEKIADYLLENGVIVPPCKVGETVYVIFNGGIYKATVYNLKIETEENHYLILIKVNVFDKISMFKVFILGKTAFLTKEEAEQALRQRKEDEGK